MGFGVWNLGSGVWGLGLVQGLGIRVLRVNLADLKGLLDGGIEGAELGLTALWSRLLRPTQFVVVEGVRKL